MSHYSKKVRAVSSSGKIPKQFSVWLESAVSCTQQPPVIQNPMQGGVRKYHIKFFLEIYGVDVHLLKRKVTFFSLLGCLDHPGRSIDAQYTAVGYQLC